MSTVNMRSVFQSTHPTSLNPLEAAKGFASDIVRRTGILDYAKNSPEQVSGSSSPVEQHLASLEQSLESTIQYLVQSHGKNAASAAMGIIYNSIGDSQVTETNLGNALLDVTRFIDANFGFQSGDSFINHLNTNLNDSLNELFQNGANELFIAVTTINGETYSTLSSESSDIIKKSVSQTVANSLDELNAITDELLKTIHENRIQPEAGTLAAAYTSHTTSLPTGVMVEKTV